MDGIKDCCAALQALIQCPHLEKLETGGCVGLEIVMLWSDKLTELDLTDSKVQTFVMVIEWIHVRSNSCFDLTRYR